ncbi:competence protein CoiA [Variovorax sp. E3]|uniref:competence protein CoiA n=1 Tax=Variovorax sp. E3 TaxID=1914993 RepID=UPI0018DDAAF6|nr:competence protein CoiA family protein [Variovorax sp. E3]
MKFANIDGQKSEPKPGAIGACRNCGAEAISKCGNHVIWHWAHKSRRHCDKWWESEGEWHRAWKARFPTDLQEVSRTSASGEKHIADICTSAGLVVELQHSTIHPAEVAEREAFYQTMVWVIDGCANEFDPMNFKMGRTPVGPDSLIGFKHFGRSKLFARWHTKKPVFIDFGDEGFWRILRYDPMTKEGSAGLVNRDGFAQLAASGRTDFSEAGGPATATQP